jgi:hypothetical protein
MSSWVGASSFRPDDIKLLGYDGVTWVELSSKLVTTKEGYVVYNATDNVVYGYYAIAGKTHEAGRTGFVDVLYVIEQYYHGEKNFIDVIKTISDYYAR